MLLHIIIVRVASNCLLGWANINTLKIEVEGDREREKDGRE